MRQQLHRKCAVVLVLVFKQFSADFLWGGESTATGPIVLEPLQHHLGVTARHPFFVWLFAEQDWIYVLLFFNMNFIRLVRKVADQPFQYAMPFRAKSGRGKRDCSTIRNVHYPPQNKSCIALRDIQ